MLYRRRRLLLLAQASPDPNLQSLITALFGNGEQGAFYVPKPRVMGQQVLFQDAAGTTPVTSDGDPVGLMLDLSGNDNHATQEVSGSRPVYRTDGTKHWLEGDGIDDSLPIPLPTLSSEATLFYVNAAGVNLQPYLPPGVSLDFLTGPVNYYYGVVNRLLTEAEEQSIRQLAAPDQRVTVPAMWLDGTNGTYASTPNSEAVDITGDLTLVAKIAPEVWAAGSNQEVISKWEGSELQYLLRINSSGGIFVARDSASGGRNQGSVSFPNAPNDRPVWIAVTMVYHDSGITFNFYTSDDGGNWSLLNSLERGNVGPGISLPDTGVAVGVNNVGGGPFSGKIYRAQVYSGAGFDLSSGPTGTLVADFNPEDASPGSTEFTSAATGETWTLHSNAMIGEYPV